MVFTDLLLTSLLSGTAGPTGFPAGGLWGRGEEGLSSSVTSVVTTSTASTCWIGVPAGEMKSWGQTPQVVCAAAHLSSMWSWFPGSFNAPRAAIAVDGDGAAERNLHATWRKHGFETLAGRFLSDQETAGVVITGNSSLVPPSGGFRQTLH